MEILNPDGSDTMTGNLDINSFPKISVPNAKREYITVSYPCVTQLYTYSSSVYITVSLTFWVRCIYLYRHKNCTTNKMGAIYLSI